MDLWTPEVQTALVGLLQAVLSIVAAWIGVEAARYVTALKAKALQAAAETGNALLENVAETAVRTWSKSRRSNRQVDGRAEAPSAADYDRQMPGVDMTLIAAIGAVLNR